MAEWRSYLILVAVVLVAVGEIFGAYVLPPAAYTLMLGGVIGLMALDPRTRPFFYDRPFLGFCLLSVGLLFYLDVVYSYLVVPSWPWLPGVVFTTLLFFCGFFCGWAYGAIGKPKPTEVKQPNE